jgi:K+-sensing histidine kinase KdpD
MAQVNLGVIAPITVIPGHVPEEAAMIELIDIDSNLLCIRISESQIYFVSSHIVNLFAE